MPWKSLATSCDITASRDGVPASSVMSGARCRCPRMDKGHRFSTLVAFSMHRLASCGKMNMISRPVNTTLRTQHGQTREAAGKAPPGKEDATQRAWMPRCRTRDAACADTRCGSCRDISHSAVVCTTRYPTRHERHGHCQRRGARHGRTTSPHGGSQRCLFGACGVRQSRYRRGARAAGGRFRRRSRSAHETCRAMRGRRHLLPHRS